MSLLHTIQFVCSLSLLGGAVCWACWQSLERRIGPRSAGSPSVRSRERRRASVWRPPGRGAHGAGRR